MPTDQPAERLERLERTAFETVVQALTDYREVTRIFREEVDKAQDIAEDVMREALESMGISTFHERLYGKVDYKKAMYVFIPEAEPIALMLDAKAEKTDRSTATIQMSQTSMRVRYVDARGRQVDEQGKLAATIARDGRDLHVVSIVTKYFYEDLADGYELKEIIVACIPNGKLQAIYNPSAEDTIWRAGRHAPTRGEEFRVRLHFGKLRDKAPWRVRHLPAPAA